MLINVKMPTIVGILTFMSMIHFVLSRVNLKKISIERDEDNGPALMINGNDCIGDRVMRL